MDETEAAKLFGALSNVDRLQVIRALVVAGPDGLSAGQIAERVGASPSRASFHLAALSEAGFITATRQARSLLYAVDYTRIGQLMGFFMNDCCAGHPQIKTCCQ